jgi:hypothetical protein
VHNSFQDEPPEWPECRVTGRYPEADDRSLESRISVLHWVLLHWKLWAALMVLSVSLGSYGVLSKTSQPWQVRAYSRITLGMTLSEVEDVIGMPAGSYGTICDIPSMTPLRQIRKTGLPIESLPDAAGRPGIGYIGKLTVEHWSWDEYVISVALDEAGKVVGYYLYKVVRAPDGTPAE